METQVYQLANHQDEMKDLLLQIKQSPEIERRIMLGDEIVAVVLPGKIIEEMKSLLEEHPSSDQVMKLPTGSTSEQLVAEIAEKNKKIEKLEAAYTKLLLTSAAAIVPQQSYVYGHNERIAIFSSEIAQECGCSEKELSDIRMAALLHDIGEIIIPAYLLEKSTTLSTEDWDVIKDHPKVGADFIRNISGMENVAAIIQAHHEKYDGSGYPKGLKANDIPLGARILCIIDAYDAMTNCRTNRKPKTHLEAVSELKALGGKNYDPELVDKFIKSF